jgi:3-oxoacyl-[acyl-carrier protein] reductase
VDLGLQGRTVLVTGATRGIGRATALAYAREGAQVGITWSNDEQAARRVTTEIDATGGRGLPCRLELGDSASIQQTVQAVVDRFGGLDVLVANAVQWPTNAAGPLGGVSWQGWQDAVRTNLEGTVDTVRAATPHLTSSAAARIVLVSSGVSREGMAGASAYATAKAALDGLAAALKWELGRAGTLINIISPGFTTTENNLARFTDDLRQSVRVRTPSGALSTPDDIAAAVLFLGSPANANITGTYLSVSGGIP